MSLRELARRFSFLLHRDRQLDDLETEMRLHRELRAAKLERQGLTHAQATNAAERQFGNKTLLKEVSANMWTWTWLDDLAKDLRHTCRMLRANPLFTLVVVLTLALGIGANSAIFSVINVVCCAPSPCTTRSSSSTCMWNRANPPAPETPATATLHSVNMF